MFWVSGWCSTPRNASHQPPPPHPGAHLPLPISSKHDRKVAEDSESDGSGDDDSTESNLEGTKGDEESMQEEDENGKEEEDTAVPVKASDRSDDEVHGVPDVALDRSNGEVHGRIDDAQEWHPWIRSKVGTQRTCMRRTACQRVT